jgi:LysW-gamma-L-alpha-aminoadipyl-6-phosphate/LysW-L-glutamyl-5-phosphate reductase
MAEVLSAREVDAAAVALDISILGASGFGGGELLRILLAHPNVQRIHAISRSHAEKPIAAIHPHLRHCASGAFTETLDFSAMSTSANPVVFAALPHGELAKIWSDIYPRLPPNAVVIDLSADFRLRDAQAFATAYGYLHPCPEHLSRFVYGLPEANLGALAGVKYIANPGCFATAIALALLPLTTLAEDVSHIHICAVTGSSGSGTQPSAGTHHPSRAHDFRAYKILAHQHESEIRACLSAAQQAGSGKRAPNFSLVPHSAPMVRGIFATCQFELGKISAAALNDAYQRHYQHSRFVSVISESPRAAAVAGSNFCELSIHIVDGTAAVLCAIDNLGKGMAGQAIQNMNLALNLPETTGLMMAGVFP